MLFTAPKKLLEYCLKHEKSFHTFLGKLHQYFLRFTFIKFINGDLVFKNFASQNL